ncbi:fungal-specific transcription factor domain-containing protein [Halteromyces radiatus]|uniref:fungal-specific transcription factor domain-containing protein n=1 Tax=Halteromyces radiatus TaxID=101107 RepID=UPI00221E7141|nr:fungal-specific transcription factor domain-containing protein [Halteromyces radiatus]KAI8092547.1 fungal-specific transcription factor domain-containing protein [Halteromyces radiatus]
MQPFTQRSSSSPSSDPIYMNNQLPPITTHPQHLSLPPVQQQQQQQQLQQQQEQLPLYSNTTIDRNPKRAKIRKPRACDLCRRKKIRCDYDPAYPELMCSSCRGYKKSCDFAETAKRRGPPKGYVEGLESRLQRMEQLLLNVASSNNLSPEAVRQYINDNTDQIPMNEANKTNQDSDHLPSITKSTNQSSISSPTSHSATKRLHGIDETAASHDSHMKELLKNAKEGKYAYLGSSSGVYMLNRLFPSNSKECSEETHNPQSVVRGNEDDVMVARFAPKSSQLTMGPGGTSTQFAKTSSRWKLPPKPVVDRLVQLYFTNMNTYLPIVDEEEFMEKYQQDYDNVSKPLLLTICHVTIRMLPVDDSVAQEYNIDRAAMFHDLCHQLETNCELDFMEPHVESIQFLLLNSANADHWSPKSTDWLATSIAVKMAQDLGLHRSNAQWTLPPKFVEARKRLWWSAYIVDRWVCASLGRPLTVNDADCDLEYPALGENDKYVTFVAIIKLSRILGDVLRAICSPRARTLGDQGLGLERISKRLDQALIEWKESLPESIWLSEDELESIHRRQLSTELEAKLNHGAGQLQILYIAVQLLAKRPRIFLGPEHSSSSITVSTTSTVVVPQECLDAVVIALDIFQVIKFPSLMYIGWSLSSCGLSQALMFIFLNHKNKDAKLVTEAKRQAESFKQHYRKLEDQFIETPLISFLDAISRMIEEDQNTAKDDSSSNHPDGQSPVSLWGTSSGMDWHDLMDFIRK